MHTFSYIHEYNLLNQYNAACMYAFRYDHLVLDIQLLQSSLGKTISHVLSIP